MVLFLGVNEKREPHNGQSHVHTTYLKASKKLIGHASYKRLVLGFFFSTLAFQMSLGNFTLFCTHVAGLGAQFQYLILAILVAATISVPMWQMTLVRLGKKTALLIGLPLLIPALVVLVSVSENFPVYLAMCVLIGASLSALFLLPWSMLPDVVDEFAFQNPSCKGLEPLFYSCSSFCNKFGGGLSAGISTMILHFTGYKAGACSHTDIVVLTLKLLLAPIPIVLLLVGLVFFSLYRMDEIRRKQIQPNLGHCTRPDVTTLPCSEEKQLPLIQQESLVFKSKSRIISRCNLIQPDCHAKHFAKLFSQEHYNCKYSAYSSSFKQLNTNIKSDKSEMRDTQEHALKCLDIPDRSSKVTWV